MDRFNGKIYRKVVILLPKNQLFQWIFHGFPLNQLLDSAWIHVTKMDVRNLCTASVRAK